MSLHVIAICRKRKFRNHTLKHVIKEMADRASDDGTGIWCSKQTLANDTGLSKDAVRRAVKELLATGIIEETGKRNFRNYYTKVYRIVLERVEKLQYAAKYTGCDDHLLRSASDGGVSCKDTHSLGDAVTPNRPITTQQPLTRKCAVAEDVLKSCFDQAWNAYPNDRRRNPKECEKKFRSAVEIGATPEGIVRATQKYEQDSQGYTRSKVKIFDNWLRDMDWPKFIENETNEEDSRDKAENDILDRCEKWIRDRATHCYLISQKQVRTLFEAKRVTKDQLSLVGLDHMLQELRNG